MIEAYDVESVRAAEAAHEGWATGELMRRAAQGVAEVVALRAAQREAAVVVVLAGPGDNGGDGLYAAALLADHEQLAVIVVQGTATLHEGGLAAVRAAGLPVLSWENDPDAVRGTLERADVVIDALLGIGARPGLSPSLVELVREVPDDAWVVAVDLPSGADPEGLTPVPDCVPADETVTFSLVKPVHLLSGREASGWLTVVDIGVEPSSAPTYEQITPDDVAGLWPVPSPHDDKYSRGVLGVVAGSAAYPGAAVLAVRAAVEAGAGMVRYVGPQRAEDLVLATCPEVVLGEGQVQAWVLGPGVSTEPDPQHDLVRRALATSAPCVVDAGALGLVDAPRPSAGARTLLTPHAGELAALASRLGEVSVTRAEVLAAPVEHARRVAAALHATVLLKGSVTYVVPPPVSGLPVRVVTGAPAWLATAGAGDVLAGVAGVLLAAGMDPLDAGALAALVHGRAAERASGGGPLRASAVAAALSLEVAALLRRG